MLLPPEVHVAIAILLAISAIFLYTRDRIPLEATSLFVLIVVLIWFHLFPVVYDGERVVPASFFAGFGNEALITVVALIVLAKSLEVTRALQPIGHVLAKLWRVQPKLAFLATMVTAAILSMFLNNTPVVAALMPLLVAVSLQAGISSSGILMPVGFATIVGGMATTIGTSTNLLVVSIAADLGMAEMRMFDFALPVIIVSSFAMFYLWLVAPKLLPPRTPPLKNSNPRIFDSRLRIEPDSAAIGKTLAELRTLTRGRMRVNQLVRGSLPLVKLPSLCLRAGDYLHVSDTLDHLKDFERLLGATILPVDADRPVDAAHPLESDQRIAEVVVMRGSPLEQNTLVSSNILSRFGLSLLAMHRSGKDRDTQQQRSVGDTVLRAGDVIVLQGSPRALERLKNSRQALVLDGNIYLPRRAMASLALVIMTAVVVVSATGFMRISYAAVTGVGLMLLTKCLTWDDIRAALDRRVILVIAASLALGTAMMTTGAADAVAFGYVRLFEGLPTVLILSGLILVMALLTELVTNNAVAVLGTPIAISIANALGAPMEPFVLAVLFGANMSYLTPVGYQTNLLVMSAGGYHFSDFLRAGIPLQLIMWLGVSAMLPVFYEI